MSAQSTRQSPKPKYVKIMLYLKRRPDCSDEKFHQHWRTNHVQLAMQNTKFVEKVRRYNQCHTSPELKKEAEEFKIPVLDCDGIAEVWVDSLKDWKEIVTDADFVKHIAADETHFIQPPITIMLGYDNLVIGTDKTTGCETEIEGKPL